MNADGAFSELYLACESGDNEQVKNICSQADADFVSLNKIESNGNTALHIASSLGRKEIVRFLLTDVGVIRYRLNTEGLTAYQVAKDDEVRQLFRRLLPDQMDRYCQSVQDVDDVQITQYSPEDNDGSLNIDNDENNEVSNDTSICDKYIDGYTSPFDILGTQTHTALMIKYLPKTRLRLIAMRFENLIGRFQGESPTKHSTDAILRQEFQTVIDQYVKPQHSQYKKACYLLDAYFSVKQIDPLIRLYTLSTPFYSKTEKKQNPLGFAMLCHLKSLEARYFQGVVYRGVVATQKCFQAYKWALKQKSCCLTNKTFWSTSADPNVARMYMNNQTNTDQLNILFIIQFCQRTEMAIRLSAIPESGLTCLSEFEDEEEVLVLPEAIFRVVAIEKDGFTLRAYTIRLENILIPVFSRRRLFKDVVREGSKQLREKYRKYRNKN
ncbi:unnamed protein product [Didymodactylos carnosus]|uniref:Mono(ADP-ribosyl)transferase n=1 Tax=Didymodactylos carnosus TaxID=1234261 RepID=A0A815QAH1_9BILA|nr:unnamed protein product [Didymodactylos carnosus]CAF1460684.1 unnamed protein product [Didymodactylos carnosus]CAF4057207.1 unnamed protein product [Didymodactylos carnosus]CAF4331030.1 unnamed protein product [Didymodactylos carnosus]